MPEMTTDKNSLKRQIDRTAKANIETFEFNLFDTSSKQRSKLKSLVTLINSGKASLIICLSRE